jgi:cellulose synthase/poly-beta-1,6-N-acetylglucosamine synthase-like glycosyltransferase
MFFHKSIRKSDITPSVSIIIAARNEEKNIARKIENTLQLDYPKELLEIIIFSDASTDRTDDIVESYADHGVILNKLKERKGKTGGQNNSVKKAKGEIIVFSDGTTIYHQDAIKKIVRNFADEKVGCVGGELEYINLKQTQVGEGESIYWKYERKIKRLESTIGSLIGVSGCIYAVRKSLYRDMKGDILSDFAIASDIVKSNYRVVYEPEAISEERTEDNIDDEFKMRIRIAVRSYKALFSRKEMMNPFKYGFYAVQLISHKLLRYLVPFILMLAFISNLFSMHIPVFKAVIFGQMLFYILAVIGYRYQKARKPNRVIFFYPFYFCLLNTAATVAWIHYWQGEKHTFWEPVRE